MAPNLLFFTLKVEESRIVVFGTKGSFKVAQIHHSFPSSSSKPKLETNIKQFWNLYNLD